MTSPTRRRTVTRQQLDESRAAWDAGDFSDEWKPWRHLAAMESGVIFPPDGTKWDSWGDDAPSQRAMLIRAIRETPEALRTAILTARRPTWEAVIEGLLGIRDRITEDVIRSEIDDVRDRSRDITSQQAGDTLRRINTILGRMS
jgi:hypothetical protein